jgi:hypothetical protein
MAVLNQKIETGGVSAHVELPAPSAYELQTLGDDDRWFAGAAIDPDRRVSVPPLRLQCTEGSRPLEEMHVLLQVGY